MAVCAFPECGKPTNPRVLSATLCRGHHYMQCAGAELRPLRVTGPHRDGCDFPGCDRPHCGLGWCKAHLIQSKTGRPLHPLGEARGRHAKPKAKDAPKATKPTSRMPAGWERVTAPRTTKPHRSSGGVKVMAIEGPVCPATPEQQAAALHVFQLLCPDVADELADMCGIEAA